MNTRLIIIGARAMGREVCAYAWDAGFAVKGFLDEKVDAIDGFEGYPPILASVEAYEVCEDDVFVVALGDPECKRKYVEVIAAKGGRFMSIVHPAAYIGKNVVLGCGCIVGPNSTITNDVIIGDHVIINVNASINHDNRIGKYATLCPGCHLAGRVRVGERTFVGTGAVVIPDVELGSGVYVAAGATVVDSFETGTIMGTPARQK